MALGIGVYSAPSTKGLRTQGICAGCNSQLLPGFTGHRFFRPDETTWLKICPACYSNGFKPGPLSDSPDEGVDDTVQVVESTALKQVSDFPFDCVSLTGKHTLAKTILECFRMGEYPFIHGAPGAGKTHLMQSLAVEASLPFLLNTFSNDSLTSEIKGSKSPLNGMYHRTAFRELWEHGGVILFDEVCLAPGAFLNVLNAAMSQGLICFPDGETIHKNPHCYIAFADNSNGWGNDPIYPERQDIGGAFRNRLTYIKFEYDTKLEKQIIANIFGSVMRAECWHSAILAMRSIVAPMMSPIVVSPRFAYRAAKFYKCDMDPKFIFESCLREGLPDDIWNPVWDKVKQYAKSY